MARKIISLLLALVGGAAGFVVSIRFFGGIGYQFLAMLLGSGGPDVMSSPVFMISLHSIVALVVFFTILQVAMNRYFIPVAKIMPALYAVLALAVIMMKSSGVQGLNLDPLDIIDQLSYSPATVFFNALVFMPFGVIFRLRRVPAKRAAALGSAISLSCEGAQLVFRLGIFDAVDIILNIFGFVFGYCVADLASSRGLKLIKASKHFYCVVCEERV